MRLTQKQIKPYRDNLLKENNICEVCNKVIKDNPVLDHDHTTGKIRTVLHSRCNQKEGKIKGMAFNAGLTEVQFLKQMISFYEKERPDVYHPNTMTDAVKSFKKLTAKAQKDLIESYALVPAKNLLGRIKQYRAIIKEERK